MNVSSKRHILKNISWLSGEWIIKALVGLPVSIVVARYLGPERVGILGYSLSLVGLFTPLAMAGLGGIVVRDLVKDHGAKETLGSAFLLQMLGSLFVTVLPIATVLWMRPDDWLVQVVVAIIACQSLFAAFRVVDYWFQSKVESRHVSIWRTVATLIVAGSKILMVWLRAPLVAFALVAFFESVLVAVFLTYIYRKRVGSIFDWRATKTRAKELFIQSWPLTISGLAIVVQTNIDQVMLGEMLGDATVGQYSLAMKMVGYIAFLPVLLQRSWAPSVTAAKEKSHEAYRARMSQLYQLMFAIFLLQGLPLFFLGSPLMITLYGKPFAESGILLSLLAFRVFFVNYGVARSVYITNESIFTHSLISAVAGSVANVVANYLIIPTWGAQGAIAATLLSFTVTIFVMDVLFAKTRENFFLMINSPWMMVRSGWRLLTTKKLF